MEPCLYETYKKVSNSFQFSKPVLGFVWHLFFQCGWQSSWGFGRPEPRILLSAIVSIVSGKILFSLSTFLIKTILLFR
jgi:hypothetical protein